MKITAQNVFDATVTVAQIIRDRRAMPQKGKYLLARLHAKLHPEFMTISNQRDEMIKAYDHRETNADGTLPEQYSVPKDKVTEFSEAWKKIGEAEIDVDVQPIPLSCLDLGSMSDGAIHAQELLTLGDLVEA